MLSAYKESLGPLKSKLSDIKKKLFTYFDKEWTWAINEDESQKNPWKILLNFFIFVVVLVVPYLSPFNNKEI